MCCEKTVGASPWIIVECTPGEFESKACLLESDRGRAVETRYDTVPVLTSGRDTVDPVLEETRINRDDDQTGEMKSLVVVMEMRIEGC